MLLWSGFRDSSVQGNEKAHILSRRGTEYMLMGTEDQNHCDIAKNNTKGAISKRTDSITLISWRYTQGLNSFKGVYVQNFNERL